MRIIRLFIIITLFTLTILLFTSPSYSFFQPYTKTEKRGLSYQAYQEEQSAVKIPPNSKDIDYANYYFGDAGYIFVKAKVEKKIINLSEIVKDSCHFQGENYIKMDNVIFKKDSYNNTFFAEENKFPSWWIDGLEENFGTNYLLAGDNRGYGYGCWAFYDDKNEILRVFRWSQQHLSLKIFQEKFGISN